MNGVILTTNSDDNKRSVQFQVPPPTRQRPPSAAVYGCRYAADLDIGCFGKQVRRISTVIVLLTTAVLLTYDFLTLPLADK